MNTIYIYISISRGVGYFDYVGCCPIANDVDKLVSDSRSVFIWYFDMSVSVGVISNKLVNRHAMQCGCGQYKAGNWTFWAVWL